MCFWLWIALWGGAELLDGTWVMNLLVLWGASDWNSESTKLVAWFFVLSSTFWFVWGLIDPNMQFFSAQMMNHELSRLDRLSR